MRKNVNGKYVKKRKKIKKGKLLKKNKTKKCSKACINIIIWRLYMWNLFFYMNKVCTFTTDRSFTLKGQIRHGKWANFFRKKSEIFVEDCRKKSQNFDIFEEKIQLLKKYYRRNFAIFSVSKFSTLTKWVNFIGNIFFKCRNGLWKCQNFVFFTTIFKENFFRKIFQNSKICSFEKNFISVIWSSWSIFTCQKMPLHPQMNFQKK